MVESNDGHFIGWRGPVFPVFRVAQTAAEAYRREATEEQQSTNYHQQPYVPEMHPVSGQAMFSVGTVLLASGPGKLDEINQDRSHHHLGPGGH